MTYHVWLLALVLSPLADLHYRWPLRTTRSVLDSEVAPQAFDWSDFSLFGAPDILRRLLRQRREINDLHPTLMRFRPQAIHPPAAIPQSASSAYSIRLQTSATPT
ncbi:hypothetical protein JAAARDRAFT_42660 [Jaapia argillacea MUCL 33604]|uniref:Uncharacterized protein n=1 Tax=Jaapia argillacea MUCL 33604 TaxID=933084 RepID=A0A067P741_9AGAM|nr:hypothetical protein JAAARDRAFT_42660 [Jaapia argillacea MUCL 33604]